MLNLQKKVKLPLPHGVLRCLVRLLFTLNILLYFVCLKASPQCIPIHMLKLYYVCVNKVCVHVEMKFLCSFHFALKEVVY